MPVYLDHNATTPLDPAVLDAMLPYLMDSFGNAASVDHLHGNEASVAVERARAQLASVIRADPSEIIFTSGATESNNLAIIGGALAQQERGRHIVTTAIEHPSVLEAFEHLETLGFEVTVLPANRDGLIDLEVLEAELTEETTLVSVMAANNEIGTIQPLREIGSLLADRGITFHTDAAQALAYQDLDVRRDAISMMSLSAHKAYGPKGVGALFVRRKGGRVPIRPLLHGGGHEKGLRPGTLNVPGIVGFGVAAERAKVLRGKESPRLSSFRSTLLSTLREACPELQLNGALSPRLPGNLNVYLPGVENRALIQLTSKEVSYSAGSACTTTEVKPSHVLLAIGRTETEAHQSIRLSVGRFTADEDVVQAGIALQQALQQLSRARSSVPV